MIFIAGILVGLVFVIESFVWFVRAMAAPSYRSKSISTSNIVMYATRVLVIGYQIILNFTIESGGGLRLIIISTLIGMVVSLLGHGFIFYNKTLIKLSWTIFISSFRALRIIKDYEYEKEVFHPKYHPYTSNLIFISAFSMFILVFVYIAPQVFATFYEDFRLTLSSVGQAISFIGMVVTLFFLDPVLFKMHDDGQIKKGFSLYLWGRIVGTCFTILTLILTLLFLS